MALSSLTSWVFRHQHSPGRRFISWLKCSFILGFTPRGLFTPNQLVLLSLASFVLFFIPITFLLPPYLSDPPGLGGLLFPATILPVILSQFLLHLWGFLSFTAMSSHDQFHYKSSVDPAWEPYARTIWNKLGIEFWARQREQLGVQPNAAVMPINSAVPKPDGVGMNLPVAPLDLSKKLKRIVAIGPKTYYEGKLLGFLFPPSAEDRRLANRRKIVFLPFLRVWVWRVHICWLLGFLVFFIIPLFAIFLPSAVNAPVDVLPANVTLAPTFTLTTWVPTIPTRRPTLPTTMRPSPPTFKPTSSIPTTSPTKRPVTVAPGQTPTTFATLKKRTVRPSQSPSKRPVTSRPTWSPSESPSKQPSDGPTTGSPSSLSPTAVTLPTTINPTNLPTFSPEPATLRPTNPTTFIPSRRPSSLKPTTLKPTRRPTRFPSSRPTRQPTALPSTGGVPSTRSPSARPTRPTARFPASRVPSAQPTRFPTSLPSTIARVLSQDDVMHHRMLQSSPNMTLHVSTFVAMYVFSILTPCIYFILFALEISWLTVNQFRIWCCRSRRRIGGGEDDDEDVVSFTSRQPPPSLNSSVIVPPVASSRANARSRYNVDQADLDLQEAYRLLNGVEQFYLFAKGRSFSTPNGLNPTATAIFSQKIFTVFRSLQNFQMEDSNVMDWSGNGVEDQSVLRVRALAMAGRMRCLLNKDYCYAVGIREDERSNEIEQLYATLSGVPPEITRFAEIKRTLLIANIARTCDDRGEHEMLKVISRSYMLLESHISYGGKSDINARRDEDEDFREANETFERGIYFASKKTTVGSAITKKIELLCWMGLALLAMVRDKNLERAEAIVLHLENSTAEFGRKMDVIRRLLNDVRIRRGLFWISFARNLKSLDIAWDQIARAANKSSKSHGFYMRLRRARNDLFRFQANVDADLVKLINGVIAPGAPDVVLPSSAMALANQPNAMFGENGSKATNEDVQKFFFFSLLQPRKGLVLPDVDTKKGKPRAAALKTSSQVDDYDAGDDKFDENFDLAALSGRTGDIGGREAETLIGTAEELLVIESAFAKAHVGRMLADLKLSAMKPTSAAVADIALLVQELPYSNHILREGFIKRVSFFIRLEDRRVRVEEFWDKIHFDPELVRNDVFANMAEECFRSGISFNVDVETRFELSKSEFKNMEDLHRRAFAAMILLAARKAATDRSGTWNEKALDWSSRAVLTLSDESMEFPRIQAARLELEDLRLKGQLGLPVYSMYRALTWRSGSGVCHFLVFWVCFILPLTLGLTFLQSNASYANTVGFTSHQIYYWTILLGLLFPYFFVLSFVLNWTYTRRSTWYGETECREEDRQRVINLVWAYRDLGDAKLGGEYPYWSLGEHLATTPGRRTFERSGRHLLIWRSAFVVCVFTFVPIIIAAPLVTVLTNREPNFDSNPYYAVLIVIAVASPIVTLLFFSCVLLYGAATGPFRRSLPWLTVWFLIGFALPLIVGIPLAMSFEGSITGAATYCWLACGPCVFVIIIFTLLAINFNAMERWWISLTWVKQTLIVFGTFWFNVSVWCVVVSPVAALIAVLIDLSPSGIYIDQGVILFTASAFEAVAVCACVIATTAGYKLGWIHPDMTSSTQLPFAFVAIGTMVLSSMFIPVYRSLSSDKTAMSTITASILYPMLESVAWAITVQILISWAYFWQYRLYEKRRQKFGYFPEDWESRSPAARFVVEDARSIPFATDDALIAQLQNRGIAVLVSADGVTLDRRLAERSLEDAMRIEARADAAFQRKVKEHRDIINSRYEGNKLVETVFSEVLSRDDDATLSPVGTKSGRFRGGHAKKKLKRVDDAGASREVFRQFNIAKMEISLERVVNFLKRRHMRLYHPTHILDILDDDFRIVNVLFGSVRPYPVDSIKELRWIDPQVVSTKFFYCNDPEMLLNCVEVCFLPDILKLERSRLIVFASMDDRDEFLSMVVPRMFARGKGWTFESTGTFEVLKRVVVTMDPVDAVV